MTAPSPPFKGILALICILQVLFSSVSSFGGNAFHKTRHAAQVPPTTLRRHRHTSRVHASTSDEASQQVDRLLRLVDTKKVDVAANGQEIKSIVQSLVAQDVNFTALVGNYNVTLVIPSQPNDKPVGGKWSRGPAQALLTTRRTLQHLLAPKAVHSVAEAVNVISLSALRDAFRIHVVLRGDAYQLTEKERLDIVKERQTPGGLSSRAVRANFDAPRIVLVRHNSSLLNLSVGPPSSVVLDTPYCDDRIRIGKGSRGSWFVFKRCFDEKANEWKAWIAERPVPKSKALAVLAGCFGVGLVGCNYKGLWRIGGIVLSILSISAGVVIGFSTGGIEQDDNSKESRSSS